MWSYAIKIVSLCVIYFVAGQCKENEIGQVNNKQIISNHNNNNLNKPTNSKSLNSEIFTNAEKVNNETSGTEANKSQEKINKKLFKAAKLSTEEKTKGKTNGDEMSIIKKSKYPLMSTLHSSVDDLLNIDRKRRALRYKRNSQYENLLSLMNAENKNIDDENEYNINYNEDEQNDNNSNNDEQEKQQALQTLLANLDIKYDDLFNNEDSRYADKAKESYNSDEENTEDNYQNETPALNLKDLLAIYATKIFKSNTQPQMIYVPRNIEKSFPRARRTSYTFSKFPYGLLPGQKRKRYQPYATGRWGKFHDTNRYSLLNQPNYEVESEKDSDEGNDEANRLYTLAALLAERAPLNYPRNKRSLLKKRKLTPLVNIM